MSSGKGVLDSEAPSMEAPSEVPVSRICYGYVRSPDGGEDALESQSEILESWAKRSGWNMVRIYVEEDYSRASQLAAAMRDMRDRGEGARRLVVSEGAVIHYHGLVRAWVEVMVCESGFELAYVSGSVADESSVELIHVLNDYQRKYRVGQMNVAKIRRRELGRSSGGPYGRDEEEREVLGKIMHMKGQQWSQQEIADHLNEEGYRTRRGKQWSPGTIRHVLKDAVRVSRQRVSENYL